MPNSCWVSIGASKSLTCTCCGFAESSRALEKSGCRRAENYTPWRCHRSHALGQLDRFTKRSVRERPRTDFTGNHLTGIEAHSQLRIHTVARTDVDGKPLGLLLNPQRSQTGTNRVVLQRHRRTEHRDDPVTREFVHRAAIPPHHRRSLLDQVGHDLTQSLRPDGRADLNRVHHIGDQDGHLLVFSRDIPLRNSCTAAVTEPRALTRLGATCAARCFGRHPTFRRPPCPHVYQD